MDITDAASDAAAAAAASAASSASTPPQQGPPPVGEFRCEVLEVWGMDHSAISRRQQELMMRGLRAEATRSHRGR